MRFMIMVELDSLSAEDLQDLVTDAMARLDDKKPVLRTLSFEGKAVGRISIAKEDLGTSLHTLFKEIEACDPDGSTLDAFAAAYADCVAHGLIGG